MNSMSMTKKILMTMLMTAGFYLASWAQMTMSVGSKQVCAIGDSITIPVDVTAFDNVGTFSIKIVYDPAVLGFGRTLNWYSGFVGPDLVEGSSTLGQLLESFVMSLAAVSAGSGKLFDIKFKYLGGNTDVNFSVILGDNEVTDDLGVPYTVGYSNGSVTQATLPVAMITGDTEICVGESTNLMAAGGVSYIWESGQTIGLINVNPSVTTSYCVTVTDANGCTDDETVNVIVNTLPTGTFTVVETPICFGDSAMATLEFSAPGPWTFIGGENGVYNPMTQDVSPESWYFHPTATTTYTLVSVTDANGCTSTINQDRIVPVNQLPTVTANTSDNEICSGEQITLTGGGAVSYVWDNSVTDGVAFAPATSLTYHVIGTDANGCSDTANVHVTVNPLPAITNIDNPEALCNGGTSSLTITAVGGTGSLEFSIDGIVFTTNNIFTGMAVGNYTVYVKDMKGCTVHQETSIGQPDVLTATSIVDDVNCFEGSDGSITINATGGTIEYTYSIDGTAYQSSNVFENLAFGTYSVTVKDNNNCEFILANISVGQPALLELSTGVDHVTCNGGSDGTIFTTVDGGTGIGQYSLDGINYQISNELTGLTAGTYTVYAKDANNCVKSKTATVFEPMPILITPETTNATCNQADGTATLTITGGTGTVYTQNWGSYNPAALTAGTYIVTVTDAANCEATSNVIINNVDAPVVTISKTDATCFNTANGFASSYIMGGTYPYIRNWGIPDTTAILAGNYSLTVTDATGCVTIEAFTINQPDQIIITPVLTHVVCNGESNGTATLAITGGIGAYTQNWGTANPTQLAAGFYTVSVSDEENCTVSSTFEITQPNVLGVTLEAQAILCNGDFTNVLSNVTGGTINYSYLWYGNEETADLTGVPAGTYMLTVTDANFCTAYTSITLSQPDALVASSVLTTPI